jgi:hypothetical protein
MRAVVKEHDLLKGGVIALQRAADRLPFGKMVLIAWLGIAAHESWLLTIDG